MVKADTSVKDLTDDELEKFQQLVDSGNEKAIELWRKILVTGRVRGASFISYEESVKQTRALVTPQY